MLLAADTIVAVDGDILGKPADREHALSMLRRLAGHTHEVISAVSLLGPRDEEILFHDVSHAAFAGLTVNADNVCVVMTADIFRVD